MMFDIPNYTDKAHSALKTAFHYPIAYTLPQLDTYLRKTIFTDETNQYQDMTIKHILTTALTKLIQLGLIDKVKSKFSTERQWIGHDHLYGSGYISITSSEQRAVSKKALKKVSNRCLNKWDLFELNKIAA